MSQLFCGYFFLGKLSGALGLPIARNVPFWSDLAWPRCGHTRGLPEKNLLSLQVSAGVAAGTRTMSDEIVLQKGEASLSLL